ncbi:MAG: endonuclease MutS2 [Ignavibacteria bacterium]|nr:endonuclease MutS2 [Ignavibacteria bacterium]
MITDENIFYESLEQIEFFLLLERISGYCTTEYGKEIIKNSLPFDNSDELKKELDLLEEAVSLIERYETIPFENFGDIKPKIFKSKVENAVLNPSEILSLLHFLQISRNVKLFLEGKSEEYRLLAELASHLSQNRLLEKHIRETIDNTGNVIDTASKELHRIRNEIIEKSSRLRRRLEKILKKFSTEELTQDEYVTLREGRFVLPVKIEFKYKVSGIIHGVSQSGATCFIEPSEVIEMNNELALLESEERREVHRILRNLTNEIGEFADNLLSNVEILSHIDALFAKAKYSLKYNCLKPVVWEEKGIFLQEIRHPLLVLNRGISNVVPLSIYFDRHKRGHLISGPNAGGKTVALKSIGLNLAMALSGFFPHGFCKTCPLKIFSSIGDLQSIEQDLSTFSSQIIRLKRIIENADSGSIVLVDEIVSGTDPHEGSLLAASILETFVNINLFFVVTTHQSYLKIFSLSKPEIENDSLEFDEVNLKPTYRFLQGVPGNSYAIELASLLGLPRNIVERAKGYLEPTRNDLNENIKTLYRIKIENENLKISLEEEKRKLEKLVKEYEERLAELKAKKKEMLDKARVEAYEIIRNANALVENAIREIREAKRSISEIKKEFDQKKKEIEEKAEEIFQEFNSRGKFDTLNVGDLVYIDDPTSEGVILEIFSEKNEALVDFNGIKVKTNLKNLHKGKLASATTRTNLSNYIKFSGSVRLDLRGFRVPEALREVDKFISEAILSNIDYVTVIHGKGTGTLRTALKEFFEAHPQVESFREGTIEEGGAGVTVVKLR